MLWCNEMVIYFKVKTDHKHNWTQKIFDFKILKQKLSGQIWVYSFLSSLVDHRKLKSGSQLCQNRGTGSYRADHRKLNSGGQEAKEQNTGS